MPMLQRGSMGIAVRIVGLEPTRLTAPDPKSGLSTNFNISASVDSFLRRKDTKFFLIFQINQKIMSKETGVTHFRES